MPRISNTNGRRMVALDLTPREQRGPYEMHDNFSPIDPPHPALAGWALQVAISAGGDAVGTRRTEWSGFAQHPQPPQLSLPVRCLVSGATAGRRLSGGPEIRIQTKRGKIDFRTSRSNSRVLKTEHRACSHNP